MRAAVINFVPPPSISDPPGGGGNGSGGGSQEQPPAPFPTLTPVTTSSYTINFPSYQVLGNPSGNPVPAYVVGGGSMTINFSSPVTIGQYASGQTQIWVHVPAGSSVTITSITTTVPPQTAAGSAAFATDSGSSYGLQLNPQSPDSQTLFCPPDPNYRISCQTGAVTQKIPTGGLTIMSVANQIQSLLIAKLFANGTVYDTFPAYHQYKFLDLIVRLQVVPTRPPGDGTYALSPGFSGDPASKVTLDLRDVKWSRLRRDLPSWPNADAEHFELSRSTRMYYLRPPSGTQPLVPPPSYGAYIARSVSSVLRSAMAVNTPSAKALQYAILMLQGGADIYFNTVFGGTTHFEYGGHAHGKAPQAMFAAWMFDLSAMKLFIRDWTKVRSGSQVSPYDASVSTSPPGTWPNGFRSFGETQFYYWQASVGPIIDPGYQPPNPPVFYNDDEFTSPFDQVGIHTGYPWTIRTATCSLVHIANLLGYTNEIIDPGIQAVAQRYAQHGVYNPGNAEHGTFPYDGQSITGPLWNEFVNSF